MVKDKLYEGHEELLARVLQPGDHFGEISLLYGCNRTATVSANNYCTLAKLSKSHLDELTHKYSKLVQKFKDRIYHYDDNVKLFIEKMMYKVNFLKSLDVKTKHEILFKMKKQQYEKGSLLIEEGKIASDMFFI